MASVLSSKVYVLGLRVLGLPRFEGSFLGISIIGVGLFVTPCRDTIEGLYAGIAYFSDQYSEAPKNNRC